MKHKLLPALTVCICLCFSFSIYGQQKITDTVYFNNKWEICEKDFASFYRTGVYAMFGTEWFYTGKFKDYTITDSLITEGEYSADGQKHGSFNFYKNNKIFLKASFENDLPWGTWKYYYPNGKERASVYFSGDEQDFKFISYTGEGGEQLLTNGSGQFIWDNIPEDSKKNKYHIAGSFKSGKRSGSWVFTSVSNETNLSSATEQYDDDGNFKTSYINSASGSNFSTSDRMRISFVPAYLKTVESGKYDNFFNSYEKKATGIFLIT